jgi:hypothetical protein
MAKIEPLRSPVAEAIERHYRDTQWIGGDWRISIGKLGEECERSIWYSFHWASPMERHEGRKVRLFATGNSEEARMIDDLRAIGCDVLDRDEATGKQFEISLLSGIVRGKADGKVSNVPGAEKTEHLLECKTHNDKNFAKWKKEGVEKAFPSHYAQCQLGMHGLGLTRALYLVHNKNTDEVDAERIKYDPLAAEKLLAKADRIAFAPTPPVKQESFACKWCRHEKTCRYDDFARVNCRTCLHSELTRDGEWRCTAHGRALTIEEQRAGCKAHLYIPELVPGTQEDADEESQTVTYSLRVHNGDGATYIDGRDDKPNVPEVQPIGRGRSDMADAG